MDIDALYNDLKQVKRRRIEIRSTKAALDLEDLNQEDRQDQLETLLRDSSTYTTRRSISDRGATAHRDFTQSETNKIPTALTRPRPDIIVRSAEDSKIKHEFDQIQEPIVISDDQEGDTNNHLVLLTDTAPSQSTNKRDMRGIPLSSHLQSPSLTKVVLQSDKNPPRPSTTKRSKIVTLRVSFNPNNQTRTTGKNLKNQKTESTQTFSARTDLLQAQPAKRCNSNSSSVSSMFAPSPYSSSSTRSLRTHSHTNHPGQVPVSDFFLRNRTHPTTSHPLQHINSQYHPRGSTDQTPSHQQLDIPSLLESEPCNCLRRNCRLCRGTPAVIAEGLSHSQPPTHNSPSTVQTHTARERPTSRPTSYHIPTFEEMTASERRTLELRFCRRVVAHLWLTRQHIQRQRRARHNPNHNSTTSVTVIQSWMLSASPQVWDVLLDGLKSLLKRQPALQGDGGENVLLGRCSDRAEFVAGVEEVMEGLCGDGGGRIWGSQVCCALACDANTEDGDVNMEGMDTGRRNDEVCLARGFWDWFDVRMRMCAECIEVCAVTGSAGERRRVVDEWEIGV